MKKKLYTSPVCNIITVSSGILLASSQSVHYDPDGITDEALAPFLDLDELPDEYHLLQF